jgi:hypothetical protein
LLYFVPDQGGCLTVRRHYRDKKLSVSLFFVNRFIHAAPGNSPYCSLTWTTSRRSATAWGHQVGTVAGDD